MQLICNRIIGACIDDLCNVVDTLARVRDLVLDDE